MTGRESGQGSSGGPPTGAQFTRHSGSGAGRSGSARSTSLLIVNADSTALHASSAAQTNMAVRKLLPKADGEW